MENKIYLSLAEKLGQGRIKINEPLSLHTTFKIGGPADYYFEANSVEELVKAVSLAKNLNLAYLVLGGGSNILVADKGIRGLVIRNKSKNIKILSYQGRFMGQELKVGRVLVGADSGVLFNQLVRFTIEEGLVGLENFLGLPGTVGGAVAGDAHWQGKTLADLVVGKRTYNQVLLSVVFALTKADKNILWQKAKEAVEYRQRTQPQGLPCAGCIFKNIKKSEAARIGTPALTTSAGFLIEAAGLKGKKMGRLQISPVHANFMVNLGGAKAADVLKLIAMIKEKVNSRFGVNLQEEVVLRGEF